MSDLKGATAFSNSGESIIHQKLQPTSAPAFTRTDPAQLDADYEIVKCVAAIQTHGFNKIALQFPDALMIDAPAVAAKIRNATGKHVYILGDTSYGSCCVDEVAAQHVDADLIIHYGRSCLSPPSHLPVIFVFGKSLVDVPDCADKFRTLFPDTSSKVIVAYDVTYLHALDSLAAILRPLYPNAIFSQIHSPELVTSDKPLTSAASCHRQSLPLDSSSSVSFALGHPSLDRPDCSCSTGSAASACTTCACGSSPASVTAQKVAAVEHQAPAAVVAVPPAISQTPRSDKSSLEPHKVGRVFPIPSGSTVSEYAVFYIGDESLTLTNLMMTYNACQFFTYNPVTKAGRKESLNVSRALMRRYFLIQKAKDANTVGIVAGTLGVADYLGIIERLKKICKDAGKKTYLFVMGKLNVAKMANFMEIDVFVLVACPENSLIESQDFYKPVITPYELEIACVRGKEWTGEYITDFRRVLPALGDAADAADAADAVKVNATDADDTSDIPEHSLVSQSLRSVPSDRESVDNTSKHIQVRNQKGELVVHSPAADFLSSRTFQGLEQKLGETPVTKAVEGAKGIASGYTHESSSSSSSGQ